MSKDNFNPVLTNVTYQSTGQTYQGFYFVTANGVAKTLDELIGGAKPFGANLCKIQVLSEAGLNYRQDGSDAVASQSFRLSKGMILLLNSVSELNSFSCVSPDGTNISLAIQFFRTEGNN